MTEKQGEIRPKLDLVQVSGEFELDYPGSSDRGSTVASKNGQIKRVTVAGVLLSCRFRQRLRSIHFVFDFFPLYKA